MKLFSRRLSQLDIILISITMLKKINYKEAIIYNNETTFHNKITNNIRNFEGKYTWLKRYKLIKLTFRLYMVQMKKVGGTYIVDYPD